MHREMGLDLLNNMMEIRENPRPGIVNALLRMEVDGEPAPDMEIIGNLGLIIGGGFDTTTALTAHAMEWLSENPDQREPLSQERDTLFDPATEEFLRYFTPAPGDGRTFSDDIEIEGTQFKEGERLWTSWAMANRDPAVFPDRTPSYWTARATGTSASASASTADRLQRGPTVFKSMLTAVLDRCPTTAATPRAPALRDDRRHPGHEPPAGDVHPGPRLGAGWTRPWKSCSGSATSRDSPDRSPNAKKRR